MPRLSLLIASIGTTLLIAASARAESTKTLRVELAKDAGSEFCVENLAGSMTVLPGDGATVTAIATIHAESEELASAMRFEQVRGADGVPTLRVIYPLDRERTIRYPAGKEAGETGEEHGRHRHWHWFSFFGWDGSEVKYAGRRVQVTESRGTLLYADVEVRVPRQALHATFRNVVGELRADGIEGQLLLDTSRGDVVARALKGTVKADTGSGTVRADGLAGSFVCDTGSGACVVNGFVGRELSCDTGSGAVRIRDVKAERLTADTGSGSVHVENADVEDFKGDTGSGGIEAELVGARLRWVKADTGSGDVRLQLPADATFQVFADQGSGDLRCGFHDAETEVRHRKVVGLRRGDAKIRITIDTGSGDARIDPRS